jgi:hypothetical protein
MVPNSNFQPRLSKRDISRDKKSKLNAQTHLFKIITSKQNIADYNGRNLQPKLGIYLCSWVYYVDRKCRGFFCNTRLFTTKVWQKNSIFYKPRHFIHFEIKYCGFKSCPRHVINWRLRFSQLYRGRSLPPQQHFMYIILLLKQFQNIQEYVKYILQMIICVISNHWNVSIILFAYFLPYF